MFLNTIKTLISFHGFTSANIKVAADGKGLYVILNLSVDLEKIKNKELVKAASMPIIFREGENGFDFSADDVMDKFYQSIVDLDEFDENQFNKSISDAVKKEAVKSKVQVEKKETKNSEDGAPKKQSEKEGVFVNADEIFDSIEGL